MENLTFYELSHIFSFLKTSDLEACRLVCRSWNDLIIETMTFAKNTKIILFDGRKETLLEALERMEDFSINWKHAEMKNVVKDVIMIPLEFLNLKSLKLTNGTIKFTELVSILEYVPTIEKLSLGINATWTEEASEGNQMVCCHLKELYFYYNKNIPENNPEFSDFPEDTMAIWPINLFWLLQDSTGDMTHIYIDYSSTVNEAVANEICYALTQLILTNQTTLKYVNLQWKSSLNYIFYEEIHSVYLREDFPNLVSFDLPDLEFPPLQQLLTKFKNLEKTNLPYLPNRDLEMIGLAENVFALKKMKNLNLASLAYIDYNFSRLSEFPLLHTLKLIDLDTDDADEDSIFSFDNSKPINSLKKLYIYGIEPTIVSPIGFFCLLFPNLTTFSIDWGSHRFHKFYEVTNVDMHHIFKSLPNLQVLKIARCNKLNDRAFDGSKIGSFCKHFYKDQRNFNPWISNYYSEEEQLKRDSRCTISALKNLQKLLLGGTSLLTDRGLKAIKITGLKIVKLPKSDYFTKEGFLNFVHNNPSLESLTFQGNKIVSSTDMEEIVQKMPRLKSRLLNFAKSDSDDETIKDNFTQYAVETIGFTLLTILFISMARTGLH